MQATECRRSHRPSAVMDPPPPSRKRSRRPQGTEQLSRWEAAKRREQILRERVAYMLWVMAQQIE